MNKNTNIIRNAVLRKDNYMIEINLLLEKIYLIKDLKKMNK